MEIQIEGSSAMIVINKRSQETKTEVSNEEPNKKFIKLSKMAAKNVDPLVYFSRFLNIPEMILNHLSAKDLIKVSEVNPLWYNVIASSKVFMENIKIVFNGIRELQTEDFDLLKRSSRKYQNIEVKRKSSRTNIPSVITEFSCISDLELDFILSKAREWKSVSIVETNFKRKLDLYNFLSSIESSVESFSVRNSFDIDGDAFPFDDGSFSNIKSIKVLKFPKLEHLKLHFIGFRVMGVTYAEFLVNSVAIERFDVTDWHGFIAMDSVLTKMLENFKNLTSLSLVTNESDLFDDQTWKRFHFKLKSFAIIFEEDNELHSSHLWDFINSQKDHLEELTIDLGNDMEMFNLIMRLPKLKILHLGNAFNASDDDVPMVPNVPNVISTSITHLKCESRQDSERPKSYPETLKFLMKSMPNVKNLYLHVIGKNIFRTLLEINRKFEELKADRLKDVKEKDLKVLLINENDKCLGKDWRLKMLNEINVFECL